MPEQGDRKIVNGVEKYYDYEYGWIDLPKKSTPKKPAGRSYDPEVGKDIDISQDPDLMGYDLDIIKPGKTEAQELLEEKIKDVRKLADLRGSVTPGSSEAAATNLGEGIQMDNADKYRPGAGFPKGVVRPTYYPTVSKEAPAPAPVETSPDAPVNTGTEIETLVKQTETKEPYSVFDDPRFMSARDRAQKRIKDLNQERRERKTFGDYLGISPKQTRLMLEGSRSPIEE